MSQAAQETTLEALKAAPPVAVAGSMWAGMSPAEWITALTILYLVLQIGLLLFKYRDQFAVWREKRRAAKQLAGGVSPEQ
ncbi:hypothetical protein N5D83_02680 [Pseudomonas chengduensis]|nr:hypothetical protein [Pseudomonas chengduensis]MDH1865723.1 hypothetical protein [Pseudomonas chengduensis]